MQNNAFQPFGPTVLVNGSSPSQAPTTNGSKSTSYRVRNLVDGAAYLVWSPGTSQTPTISAVAPTYNVPSANTLGFSALQVQSLVLPPDAWFLASGGATFEVTPGEGI